MWTPTLIYHRYITGTRVNTLNMAAGQTAVNVIAPDNDTYISPAATTLTITFLLTAITSFSCIALAGENLTGVLMEIRASTSSTFTTSVQIAASAVISTGTGAAVRLFATGTYRYWRVIITNATPATRFYYVVLSPNYALPYFEEDPDFNTIKTECSQLVSPSGHLLGVHKKSTDLSVSLKWGQVLDSDYAILLAWANACVVTPRPFFVVPDITQNVCYFGRTEEKFTFSAPLKNGLRQIAPIPFITRL